MVNTPIILFMKIISLNGRWPKHLAFSILEFKEY